MEGRISEGSRRSEGCRLRIHATEGDKGGVKAKGWRRRRWGGGCRITVGIVLGMAMLTRSAPGSMTTASMVACEGLGVGGGAAASLGCFAGGALRLRGGKPKHKRGRHRAKESESDDDDDEEEGGVEKRELGSYSVSDSSQDENWDMSGDSEAEKRRKSRKAKAKDNEGLEEYMEPGVPRMFGAPLRLPREDKFDYDAYGAHAEEEMISINSESDDGGFDNLRFGDLEEEKRSRLGKAKVVVNEEGEEEEGEEGGGKGSKLTKAEKKRLRKQGIMGGGEIKDKNFGRRPEDMVDGGAFEERIGTFGPEDNRFTLPPGLERKLKRGADPLIELGKMEQAAEKVREKVRAKKAAKRAVKEDEETKSRVNGVMFVGGIPFAFEEEQQFQYFSQFGKVLNIRLSKHPKSGKNRGFGWVLWEDVEVGKQVAQHMDGHYMFKKTLRVHMVAPDKVHPELFKNAGRKFRKVNWSEVELKRQLKPKTPEQQARCDARRLKRQARMESKVMKAYGKYGWKYDEHNSERVRLEKQALAEDKAGKKSANQTASASGCSGTTAKSQELRTAQVWDDSLSEL